MACDMEKCRRHPNHSNVADIMAIRTGLKHLRVVYLSKNVLSGFTRCKFLKASAEFDDQLGNDDGLPYTVVFN